PGRAAVVRFPTGHPSSGLPNTDGRHDRTGHGTWMLLAVFVARDDRPWLSVTGTCGAGFGLFAPGMDPRACDGWTTVCPLWLLRGPCSRSDFFGRLQAGTIKFLHRELFRVDSVETANVEHYHIPAALALAVGVRLNPAGLAERVMNPAVVELILGQLSYYLAVVNIVNIIKLLEYNALRKLPLKFHLGNILGNNVKISCLAISAAEFKRRGTEVPRRRICWTGTPDRARAPDRCLSRFDRSG